MIKLLDLFKENKQYILETLKQAKMYVDQGKLASEDLDTLTKISPDPKYLGWLAKIWMTEKPDIDDLRNNIEEYDVFAKRGKALTKDINQFKTFKDLYNEVDQINKSGAGVSSKSLENEYDVIKDDSNLYIASPRTHEASRKLGLSKFAFRDCEGGGKDSAWCTTYKAPDHFNNYYYRNGVTFYYIRVLSEDIKNKLQKAFPKKYKSLEVVALAILPDGQMDAYDGLDKQIPKSEIKKFLNIIGY